MEKNFIVKSLDFLKDRFYNGTSLNPGKPLVAKPDINPDQKAMNYELDTSFNMVSTTTTNDEHVELRRISNECEVLRSIIDIKKNQISKFKFIIKNKNGIQDNNNLNKRRDFYINFFNHLDKIDSFSTNIRKLTEELCVVDRIALEPIYSLSGQVEYFNIIDACTIKPILDGTGRLNICSEEREKFYYENPNAPIEKEDISYQQLIRKQVVKSFTYKQLIFKIYDKKLHAPFDINSLVKKSEKVASILIMKDIDVFKYMKDGNLSNILIGADSDKDYTPEQLSQYEKVMNATLRKKNIMKLMPWKLDVFETKRVEMKTELEEYCARRLCAMFGVSPQPFIKDGNRATAQVAANQEIEQVKPFLDFYAEIFNEILVSYFNEKQLEFDFDINEENDEETLSKINNSYLLSGVLTINEVRNELGYSELTEKQLKEFYDRTSGNSGLSMQAEDKNRENATKRDQNLDESKR